MGEEEPPGSSRDALVLRAANKSASGVAAVVRFAPGFTPAEQDRAYAAAAHDPRLRVALEAAGPGLTKPWRRRPQLVARWEDA